MDHLPHNHLGSFNPHPPSSCIDYDMVGCGFQKCAEGVAAAAIGIAIAYNHSLTDLP